MALIVLDGWGCSERREGNAVAQARTPRMDGLEARYPHTRLSASGEAVGLTPGQMGNSNVGHLNLGAGRTVYQDLMRVSRAVADGSFFTNPVLVEAVDAGRAGRLHLLGLCSDGGVHSHLDHLLALLDLAQRRGCRDVVVHAITDGRDTAPQSSPRFLAAVAERMAHLGLGRFGTVMGRYYAMDRDKRWERTALAYRALAEGEGERAPTAEAAVQQAYARGETDEFIRPTVVGTEPPLRAGDSVLCFNFRADRARQLTRALCDPHFDGFPRRAPVEVHFAGMALYEEDFPQPAAFPRLRLDHTLGEVVSAAGLRQLRLAETEKYAHVTYFFNGGEESPFPGEERHLVPSPKVATYDLKPEMSAADIAAAAVEAAGGPYRLLVINFANADMVGHTGSMPAAVAAVEAADACLGRVVEAVLRASGAALIVADHGNAEAMIDQETGGPLTAHTTNPVPCILATEGLPGIGLRDGGTLADAAPTVLQLLGLAQPEEMTGRSLIVAGGRPAAGGATGGATGGPMGGPTGRPTGAA